jgi:formate hydrogenlyase subunit 4
MVILVLVLHSASFSQTSSIGRCRACVGWMHDVHIVELKPLFLSVCLSVWFISESARNICLNLVLNESDFS